MKYSDYFKDPRWQKKRLEILERDDFCCQICFDTKETLNVHHRIYSKGKKPWEYDNKHLVTLCETCHSDETKVIPDMRDRLVNTFKEKFFFLQIDQFLDDLFYTEIQYNGDVFLSAIGRAIKNKEKQKEIIDWYFKELDKRDKKLVKNAS